MERRETLAFSEERRCPELAHMFAMDNALLREVMCRFIQMQVSKRSHKYELRII